MTVIPAFEIGVWNAWILALALVFLHVTLRGSIPQETEGRINVLVNTVLCLLFTYSVFLPLRLGTTWFCVGLGVFLLGVVVLPFAGMSWANVAPYEPVTKGAYRYSRHPFYLAMLVQVIGMGIASASWVFLSASSVLLVLMNALAGREEASCLEKYGKAYCEYMKRTPRWMGIPGSRGE